MSTNHAATFVVFHGVYGHHRENWFPYIKECLEDDGHNVFVPDLPMPPAQSLNSWSAIAAGIITNLNPADTILIGHSTGTILAMYMAECTLTPFKAIFLVCPFIRPLKQPPGQPDFIGPLETFVTHKFNWSLVRNGADAYFCYAGGKDPYVEEEFSQEVARKLGCSLKIIRNAGHINEASGFLKFPLLYRDMRKICGEVKREDRLFDTPSAPLDEYPENQFPAHP